ncbi:MAG: hypothetical protein U0V87_17235 [Acidobacteriota bacterium]
MNRLIPMLLVKSMPASVESKSDEWGWAMLHLDDCRLTLDQSIHLHADVPRESVLYL